MHPSSQTINLTQTATFTCNATGYISSYQWTIQSGSFPGKVTGINSNTLVIPNVRSSDANTYTCVASNQAGMVSSRAKLTVAGMIIIDILPSLIPFVPYYVATALIITITICYKQVDITISKNQVLQILCLV